MAQLDVLWEANQKRLQRETRARLTENYVASFDAAYAVARLENGERVSDVPWYAKEPEQKGVGLTGEALDKALAMWKLQFPERIN